MSLEEWWWIYDLHEATASNAKTGAVDWETARRKHAEKMSGKSS